MKKTMNPEVMKTNKMKNPWAGSPFIRPAIESVGPVKLDDLSRFEGEGGSEAPVPATELIAIPLANTI
jgi:hypothetical protein